MIFRTPGTRLMPNAAASDRSRTGPAYQSGAVFQHCFRSQIRNGCMYMPSEPHGEGDIAVELWKKLEPGEK